VSTQAAGGSRHRIVQDVVASAAGAEVRHDPVEPRTGGPAGNARLTAWIGLLLLVGFVVECATLLSLREMLNVHILVGGILIPLVVVKTATTGWRIARYYSGSAPYRTAGPPPLLLRVLGPLVVVTGLAVLGTGLALIPLGQSSFTSIVTVAGQRVDALTLHKLSFVLWLVVTGAHVLARTVPAMQLAGGRRQDSRRVPGAALRLAIVALTLGVSAGTGIVVVDLPSDWNGGHLQRPQRQDEGLVSVATLRDADGLAVTGSRCARA
jgi:hypothetical protein